MSNPSFIKKKYKRFSDELDDCGFSKYQFEKNDVKIPYKSIALAIILFVLGTTLNIISLFHIYNKETNKLNDTSLILFFLSLLMIIPGAYHVRIAVYAYKKFPGFSYEDIPDYD